MTDLNKKNLIGVGLFTKCYLNEDKKTVTLVTDDHIKECMSLDWFPDSRLFPEVGRTGDNDLTMEYYPKVKSLKNTLNEKDYRLYKFLKTLRSQTMKNKYELHTVWHKNFDTIPDEFSEERKALKYALDACSNYGSDIGFEISPRNVTVKNGQLILLDCFFMVSQVEEKRAEARQRHTNKYSY